MNIGQKIKKILEEKKFKQSDLIKFILNIDTVEPKHRAAFSRYLSGEHKYPSEYLIKTAMFLKIDPKGLLEENGNIMPPTRRIPVLGVSSCGVPCESNFSEYVSDVEDFVFYTGIETSVYAIKAFGDSMETYIQDGETLFFEVLKNNGITDGEVVHYSYAYGAPDPDDNGIKVYKKREDGSIYLKPLNGKYDNIEVEYPDFLKMSRMLEKNSKAKKF